MACMRPGPGSWRWARTARASIRLPKSISNSPLPFANRDPDNPSFSLGIGGARRQSCGPRRRGSRRRHPHHRRTHRHKSAIADDVTSVFRGASQSAPGGQAGAPVSIQTLKMALGGSERQGLDLVHVPDIVQPDGVLAYGNSPHINGSAVLDPSVLPLIEITNKGLGSMNEGVATVFHEIYHQRMLATFGVPGAEVPLRVSRSRCLQRFCQRVAG